MARIDVKISGFLFLVFLTLCLSIPELFAAAPPQGDRLTLSGSIKNLQGKGVKEVDVEVLLDGRHLKPADKEEVITTGRQGNFLVVFHLPQGTLPSAQVEVKVAKPCWEEIAPTAIAPVQVGVDQQGNPLFQAQGRTHHETPDHPGFLDGRRDHPYSRVILKIDRLSGEAPSFMRP